MHINCSYACSFIHCPEYAQCCWSYTWSSNMHAACCTERLHPCLFIFSNLFGFLLTLQYLSDTECGGDIIEDNEEELLSSFFTQKLDHDERKLLLSEVPIPPLLDAEQPFPATIIQEHALMDMERFAASVQPSGLSERVDNIVRGFQVRGPLNRDILSRALDAVARLHPMLTVQFYKKENRLFIQCNPGMYDACLWIWMLILCYTK